MIKTVCVISGGIDSAIVMQTFYNCNKTFTPFVAEFRLDEKLLNEYDLYKNSFGGCPNSHKVSRELITLPIHCHMTEEDCKYVVKILKKAINKWN